MSAWRLSLGEGDIFLRLCLMEGEVGFFTLPRGGWGWFATFFGEGEIFLRRCVGEDEIDR